MNIRPYTHIYMLVTRLLVNRWIYRYILCVLRAYINRCKRNFVCAFVYDYLSVCLHVYMLQGMCACVYKYKHTHTLSHSHVRIKTHTHTRANTHTHIHTHSLSQAHTHPPTHTHTHTQTHTHAHTHGERENVYYDSHQ